MRFWQRDELVPLLEEAGFVAIRVLPGIDEHTLVYVANRELCADVDGRAPLD
jgi:hypothetical protein